MRGVAYELFLALEVFFGTFYGAAGTLGELLELLYVCAHGQVVHAVAKVVAVEPFEQAVKRAHAVVEDECGYGKDAQGKYNVQCGKVPEYRHKKILALECGG